MLILDPDVLYYLNQIDLAILTVYVDLMDPDYVSSWQQKKKVEKQFKRTNIQMNHINLSR